MTRREIGLKRILIIDDEKQVRDMLRMILDRAGYEVEDAPDGKAGIRRRHCENPADLIITDILMPEKEGIETIMTFQKDFPECKCIAISGGGGFSSPYAFLATAKKLGAARVFTKPVNRGELLVAVEELIGR